MDGIYSVKITVKSQSGFCHAGHKPGDSWIIDKVDWKTPGGMCVSGYECCESMAFALRFGAVFPWEKDPDASFSTCPDPGNPVVFEVRRLRE